jgi:hypothetical protein
VWEDIFRGTEEDIANLIERVNSETKATRKKASNPHFEDGIDDFVAEDDREVFFHTPKKKRKTSAVSTPRKQQIPSKVLTPSHKKYAVF